MRDAFGGAFMIKLMLIFLVIYVCFIAVALNYAKAFKAKNGIIDLIERYEGYENCQDLVNSYLSNIRYYVKSQSGDNAQYSKNNGNITCYDLGYCIESFDDASGSNYIVTTFLEVNFFGFDSLAGLSFTVPIRGEVRIPIRNL